MQADLLTTMPSLPGVHEYVLGNNDLLKAAVFACHVSFDLAQRPPHPINSLYQVYWLASRRTRLGLCIDY